VADKKEEFEVLIPNKIDEDTVSIIGTSEEIGKRWLEQAMYQFNSSNNQYSTYLNEETYGDTKTSSKELEMLADNPQGNLEKIRKVNSIIKFYINKDDLIGKVYETIESNINTEFRLSFPTIKNGKTTLMDDVKRLIESFNKQINLKQLLRKAIPIAYAEGNYPMYLRSKGDSYIVDHYSLGVLEVSDYEIGGEPVLLINMNELKSRLQKTNIKTRKGKKLFFDKLDEEIKENYPEEIYRGYTEKDTYVKLNVENTGIIRVNNMNRKYGLSPIFRTLSSSLILETFDRSDRINARAKAKKIIFLKLHKEILGTDYNRQSFEEMAYTHENFLKAWKNETVIFTPPAFVEDIKYIEPKTESTNINNVLYHRNKQMTSLGIGFLSVGDGQTYTSANISVNELMKTINKICEQLQDIIEKWYRVVLQDNNIPLDYCPTLKLLPSEELDKELKLKLAELLYSKFNSSLETAYGLLGINVEDEKQKRIKENEQNYEQIFTPRSTSYTNSGNTDSGRPVDNNNPDKQVQDQDRRNGQ
jgi:hypothetical protein